MVQFIVSQEILSPKLLTKYHKTINEKGGFTTRLVITMMNFTATLYKIGYLRIKNYGQGEVELFTHIHFTGIQPEVDT